MMTIYSVNVEFQVRADSEDEARAMVSNDLDRVMDIGNDDEHIVDAFVSSVEFLEE